MIDINQPAGFSLDFLKQQRQYLPLSNGGPPPYRNPPQTIGSGGSETISNGLVVSGPTSPQSVPDSPVDVYQTHSAKFPVIFIFFYRPLFLSLHNIVSRISWEYVEEFIRKLNVQFQ